MTKSELLSILRTGEDTRHEFKVDVTNAKSIGAELAAFANGGGGWLIIGVSDEGTVVGFGSKDARTSRACVDSWSNRPTKPVSPKSARGTTIGGAYCWDIAPGALTKLVDL